MMCLAALVVVVVVFLAALVLVLVLVGFVVVVVCIVYSKHSAGQVVYARDRRGLGPHSRRPRARHLQGT
jgi:hypothetical protein